MKPFVLLGVFFFTFPGAVCGQGQTDGLDQKMGQAWDVVWGRFFHPDSQTFMDYLSSYEPGKELAHLPTAQEVGRQYPNPCGYSTGMEDGMILGGAMLSTICDRYAVTGETNLRNDAARVFAGMRRCATVHGVPGFVARNVCVEDGRSVYINSSRDQYTHFVHGLWKYYRSPLPDEATKTEIAGILDDVAERMIEFVTPENNYDFCRADGTRCPLGICRMWNVQAHEAARLPMIYAAAWEATGRQRYRQLWRQYAAPAVEQSASPSKHSPAYALLQMQCSLEVLYELEPDEVLKGKLLQTMQHVSSLAAPRLEHVMKAIAGKSDEQLQMLGPDWRKVEDWINQAGYMNPQWGPYREIWHLVRETGESALIPMMVDGAVIDERQMTQLNDIASQIDYRRCSSCGIVYHLAAYWKARRCQMQ